MTKEVKIGNIAIGGGNAVAIQSMTNTKTTDIDGTLEQITRLEKAGCDIVRCSVPDKASAEALRAIVQGARIPVVADIHFDADLAVMAAESGASKIRINPGNIGSHEKVKYLADFLRERKIPIRIGVNGGSLDKKYEGHASLAEAMAKSAMEHVRLLEEVNFNDIVISVKSSDVKTTVDAYRLLSSTCEYPLHLGVTEAGIYEKGIVKSAIGIGSLLLDGIGDTIRVSLTDDPVKEVYAARNILECAGLTRDYVEVVACPTCARTNIEVEKIARAVTEMTKDVRKPLKVAVMGCVVNGIGESKDADMGVAGGKGKSALFKKGEIVASVPNDEILTRLKKMIEEELEDDDTRTH